MPEQVDAEKLIAELEIAVDRLRSLYDQYFMGIEKLEPTVPRKEVDRRIHLLRKEQIRNTALRFRFQMVLQRYNTYQTFWQRICREIENGTYKRHLLRANQRFSDGRASRPPSRRPPPPTHPPHASHAPPASSRPPPSRPQLNVPPSSRPQLATQPSSRPPGGGAPASRPQPGAPLPPHLAAELAELDREFAPALAPPRVPRPMGPGSPAVARPLPTGSPTTVRAASPGSSASVAHPGAPGSPAGVRPGPASPVGARPASPGGSVRPASPPGSPPAPPRSAPASPAPGRPVPPSRSPVPVIAPIPARAPAPHVRPAPPAIPLARASVPAGPPRAPVLTAKPTQPQAPRRDEGLSDDRVRQLYSELVDARRRHNEPTASLTYEAVAKNLRESSARLREKHGKAVDFELTVKDGKPVLRPVIK